MMKKLNITPKTQWNNLFTKSDIEDLDFFASLHKFGLDVDVSIKATPSEIKPIKAQKITQKLNIQKWNIEFIKWSNTMFDEYDFNPDLGFSLPNPDYESNATYAISPSEKIISYSDLKHDNLDKFNKSGLAKVYKVSGTWEEKHSSIRGGAEIDVSRFYK